MVAIVLRCDAKGAMWASQATLAKDCKLSDRSVREKLSSLMEKKLLIRVKRPGTSDYCMVDVRRLSPEVSSAPQLVTLEESSGPPGWIFRSPRKDFPIPPEESSANLPKELPIDLPKDLPTVEKAEEEKPTKDFGKLWNALNRVMDREGSRALKLTKKRREALKARIKEHGEDALFDVVRWYHCSSHPRAVFLRERGYTIDTVLQRSKFDQYATMAELPEGTVIESKDPLSILGAARKLRLEEGQ
jgi:hypothetical protein